MTNYGSIFNLVIFRLRKQETTKGRKEKTLLRRRRGATLGAKNRRGEEDVKRKAGVRT